MPSGQERRLVTILFTDVTGSTGLGERLDPERLQEVLEIYFTAMREEIEAEGGTVEKFIGDAIMAAFGVPNAHEDDPARALRAALRMRRRLVEVNANLEQRFGIALEVRTGVNTGEVLAVTSPRPGEPMLTGDTMNIAARLEQIAEPGQVIVAERTARAARGFRFRTLGEQRLRGKEASVPAVHLLDEAPNLAERGVPGLRAPMVGRDSELDLLRSLYRRSVSEARPALVTIYGDPGVGKSRLAAEFVHWADAQTPAPVIIRGRCLPYGDGVTYWPLAEIMKGLAGTKDTDPPEVALQHVRVLGADLITPEVAADPRKATAALAYSVGLEDPDYSLRSAEPREVRLKMHGAWRSLFSALASRSPLVAIVEDIHWADPAMLDLLEELADRVIGPVLFVCSARPELTDTRPGWGGRRNVSSISLDPLTAGDSDRLIGSLLAVDDLPSVVRARILERAEGNPFFLEEIVRHMIDERSIVRDGDRWRAAPNIGEVVIPDTVQAVLAARIDLLDGVEKRALQRAAVVGRVFWPGPLGRLLNGDRDQVRETVGRLEERELVLSRLSSTIAGEQEFIFKHVLTREVAYASLPRRERSMAHATVASWIEETAGDRAGEFIELLAYHYLEAYVSAREEARSTEKSEYLRRRAFEVQLDVARQARSRWATRKSKVMAERAIELAEVPLERIAALEEAGLTARSDYRGDDSWRHLKEAVDLRLQHTSDEPRAIARTIAWALESPLRWPGSMKRPPSVQEVRRYLDLGFEHLDDEDSEEAVRLLTLRAFQPFGFGWQVEMTAEEREQAHESGIRAAELAARRGRLDLESAALDGAGAAIIGDGLYGQKRFRTLIERRLAIAELTEDPWEAGDIYAMGAWNQSMIGNFRDSIRLGFVGRDRASEAAEGLVDHCLNWVGASRFQLGDWDGVLEVFRKCQALMGERAEQPPYFMMNLFGAAAFVLSARGLPDAHHLLDLVEASRGKGIEGSVTATYWLAWEAARRGRLDRTWELIRDADISTKTMRPFGDQVIADVLVITERWDDVPQFLAASRSFAREAELLALPVHLVRLEGRAALVAGERQRGLELLKQACVGFADLGAAWERARTELDIAEALADMGLVDDARARLGSAIPDFERAGSLIEIARSREVLRAMGESHP